MNKLKTNDASCDCGTDCCQPPKSKRWMKIIFVVIVVAAASIVVIKLTGKSNIEPQKNSDSIPAFVKITTPGQNAPCCPQAKK